MKNFTIPVILAVVLISLGVTFWFGLKATFRNKYSDLLNDKKITERIWAKGNLNSPVVLTEYADFQCPACAALHQDIEEIVADYQNKIKFEYRHFPLNYHRNSFAAAQAAEAAGNQGKFWEMAKLLFSRQAEWEKAAVFYDKAKSYGSILNLNLDQFAKDYQSRQIKDKITQDRQQAENLSLPGTPSFLINNELVEIESEDELKKLLNEAIDSKIRAGDNQIK